MGSFLSSSKPTADKEFKNFYDIIDYISTYYILTADFKSLRKLTEKEYCDKLIVVTADIIKNNFNNNEIMFLAQRIKGGLEVNEMTKENYTHVTHDQLNDLDVRNDLNKDIKKKRVCIGIAKFYIKIAHVFASIVMTINPTYTYKDEAGQTVEVGMMEKDKIPAGVDKVVNKFNICDNRIRALKRGLDENSIDGKTTMNPKICDINLDKDGNVKSLADEPGISQLDKLYFDDKYDYSNGTFTGMSDATKYQYRKDLAQFYKAFSGKEGDLPQEITQFSEIKLRDYSMNQGCQNEELLKQKITLSKNEQVFVNYASHLKNTIQRAADNQSKLLKVINNLFAYVKDPYTGKTKIRVNPKLTDSLLQQNVELTRNLIIRLYVQCEMDYLEGVKLYEVIIQSKIYETTGRRLNNLKMEANKLLDESRNALKPVENKPMFNRPPTESTSDSSMSDMTVESPELRPGMPPIARQERPELRPGIPPIARQEVPPTRQEFPAASLSQEILTEQPLRLQPHPNVGLQPLNVGLQPPNVGLQPPPNVSLQPLNVGLQPPNVSLQPPNVGLQPNNRPIVEPHTFQQQPGRGIYLANV